MSHFRGTRRGQGRRLRADARASTTPLRRWIDVMLGLFESSRFNEVECDSLVLRARTFNEVEVSVRWKCPLTRMLMRWRIPGTALTSELEEAFCP